MSIYAKALVILATALLSLPYATDPPDWDAELNFDDFQDMYGDDISRNYTGAIMSYSVYGEYYEGDWGYWYVYQGGSAEVQNPGNVKITSKNIKTAFDTDAGCMHFKFDITKKADYCAIASNILDDGDWCDFSTLTAISLRAKGEGWIRVYMKSKLVEDNYDWGHLGYVIELSSDWETINIPVSQIEPAEYSDVTESWSDVMAEIGAFVIEANSNDTGAKTPSEVYIDDIVFKGMKYSDIITPNDPNGVSAFRIANHTNSFSVNNNAITYSVAQPQNVSFSVIDLNGNLVRQITRTSGTAGTHSITLPELTSGNYLIRMNSANSTATRRFSVIR